MRGTTVSTLCVLLDSPPAGVDLREAREEAREAGEEARGQAIRYAKFGLGAI